MIRKKFTNKTKRQLIETCRLKKWRKYSALKKSELIDFVVINCLKEEKASKIIQKNFRNFIQKKKNLTEFVNDDCIFECCAIEDIPSIFIYHIQEKNFKIYRFHIKPLFEYLCTSGKFSNPYTNTPLDFRQFRRIQQHFFKCFPGCRDVTVRVPYLNTPLVVTDNMYLRPAEISRATRAYEENERLIEYLQEEIDTDVASLVAITHSLPDNDASLLGDVFTELRFNQINRILRNLNDIHSARENRTTDIIKRLLDGLFVELARIDSNHFAHNLLFCIIRCILGATRNISLTYTHPALDEAGRNFLSVAHRLYLFRR